MEQLPRWNCNNRCSRWDYDDDDDDDDDDDNNNNNNNNNNMAEG